MDSPGPGPGGGLPAVYLLLCSSLLSWRKPQLGSLAALALAEIQEEKKTPIKKSTKKFILEELQAWYYTTRELIPDTQITEKVALGVIYTETRDRIREEL